MNGDDLMIVIIVAIVMIASIFKARARFQPHSADNGARLENDRLRHEVQELKERLKVLERIAVEKENSLAKEIESLRDH